MPDFSLDLCRLHLSLSQTEFEDAPFVYKPVATSDLTKACHILRTRILSHTVGFLDLTPSRSIPWVYGKGKDGNPILFAKVSFLHRTTRDFFLSNDEAKSFLAHKGFNEAQVTLSIARVILSRLAEFFPERVKRCSNAYEDDKHEADEDEDDEFRGSEIIHFEQSLAYIAKTERLVGAAQRTLMQSLNFESLAKRCSVRLNVEYGTAPIQGTIKIYCSRYSVTSDIVGMAARQGMTLYVCEQLGLSPKSRIYSSSLPSLKYYSQNKALPVRVFWKKLNQSQDLDTGEAIRLCSSGYRQALGECLRWGYFSQLDSRIDTQLESISLAATYILTQCSPHNTDLVRILSQAGARPMARLGSSEQSWPFWLAWLLFLQEFRLEYMKANGSSGGFKFSQCVGNVLPISLDDIFKATEALLARGADINCDTEFYHEGWSANNLKRLGLHHEN